MPLTLIGSYGPADPTSILVLAREHIGDLVCTTPALRSLRDLYPNAHITVEVGSRAASVLVNNPNVDELITRPAKQGLSGKARFVRLMRRRRFDLAVILDDSADMALYVWLGGALKRVGLTRKRKFANLLTTQIPVDRNAHEMVDNFLSVVGALGGETSDRAPELFPTEEERAKAIRILREAGVRPTDRVIAFNPTTSTQPKNWPPDRFAELGNIISEWPDTKVLILGGPGDRLVAAQIANGMQTQPIVLTGTTVMEQAEIQRRCALLVAGDTGPMHMACATGTPVVGLFGITDPNITGPLYVPNAVAIRKVDGCPGCSWERCVNNNRCMWSITAEEVAEACAAVTELAVR